MPDTDTKICFVKKYRKNCFIGQVNNVLCTFGKLDSFIMNRLFKVYCSSFYGCELWDLDNKQLNDFCIACCWGCAECGGCQILPKVICWRSYLTVYLCMMNYAAGFLILSFRVCIVVLSWLDSSFGLVVNKHV